MHFSPEDLIDKLLFASVTGNGKRLTLAHPAEASCADFCPSPAIRRTIRHIVLDHLSEIRETLRRAGEIDRTIRVCRRSLEDGSSPQSICSNEVSRLSLSRGWEKCADKLSCR